MKHALIAALAILSLLGCRKCKETQVNVKATQVEWDWMVYEKGDVITFRNESGIEVSDTVRSVKADDFIVGSDSKCDPDPHFETIQTRMDGSGHFKMLSKRTSEQDTTYARIMLDDNFLFHMNDQLVDSVLVNGVYYNQVYQLEKDSNTVGIGELYRLWFKKEAGLGMLKYLTKGGSTWERVL